MERTSEAPAKSCQESELIDAAIPRTGVSPSPPSIATVGRRRGRRKVMKKKTTKDEEGYLGSCSTTVEKVHLFLLSLTCCSHSNERGASMGIVF